MNLHFVSRKRALFGMASLLLPLFTGAGAHAQSYSNAVMALNPVAYWPLTETVAPAGGLYVATNSGTLGAAGNGYYETWWQTNGVSPALFSSNSIVHIAGAIAGDSDTAMQQGVVGQYVVIPRATNGVVNSAVTLNAPFSIEGWIYPTNATANQLKPIIAEGFNSVQVPALNYQTATEGFGIGMYSGFLYFVTYNGTSTKTEIDTGTIALNQWHHFVATFDGTSQKLYFDGALINTKTPSANSFGQRYVPDPVSPLIIGGGNELGISGGANTLFGGGIDEVAIYNAALTQTQVTNHYAFGTNSARVTPYAQVVGTDSPAIYLRLDEPTFGGAAAPNAYPAANNYGSLGASANGYYLPGTMPGSAGPTFSGFGSPSYAVALNGFNAGVDVGAGSLPVALNPTNNQPVTVTAWFKGNPADCVGRFQTIVGHSDASWRLTLDNNAGNRFNPGNGPELQFASLNDELANGIYVNDGNWHFVSGVSDGTNDFLYIDGMLAKTGTGVGTITNGTLQDVILGGDPQYLAPQPLPAGAGGRFFDGSIAQIAFFTNALNGAQIQQLYTAAGAPPVFHKQPVSQSFFSGQTANLAATVSGGSPLTYQWYLQNGAAVSGQTNLNLLFNPVSTANSGSYYLVASNPYGNATSVVATINVSASTASAYATVINSLNPAGYWPLDEVTPAPSGYVATNLGSLGATANGFYETWFAPSGNGFAATNNIVHTNGAPLGDNDTAMYCGRNTGSGQYVVIPRSSGGVQNQALTLQPPFTIESWLYPNTTSTNAVMPIFSQGAQAVQGDSSVGYANVFKGCYIGQYGGNVFFVIYNGSGQDSTKQEFDIPVQPNNWYHFVMAFDGTNAYAYLNGNLVGGAPHVFTGKNSAGQIYVPDPNAPILLGNGRMGYAGSEWFGRIDEVAVYTNTLLNAGQVSTHYAATNGNYSTTVLADNPAVYLRLDEPAYSAPASNSFPVAYNYGSAGAAANGVYQPGTIPGVSGPNFTGFGGASSHAVALNGINGAVDVGGGSLPTQLNPTAKTPTSVTAWFRANPADAPARYQELVGHGANSSYQLALDVNSGEPSFNPGNGPTVAFANTADAVVTNNMQVNDGNWHMAAAVSDGVNAYLYLDGILAKTNTNVGSVAGNGLDLFLGGDPQFTAPIWNNGNNNGPRYFNGQLAQVAIFTNVLSVSQVQQLYTAAGVAPYITIQPKSGTYNAGTAVTLSVAVTGSAPLYYQWYGTNGAALLNQTNANLVFNSIALTNAGNYFAVITNAYGAVTSSVVQLTVNGPPVVQQQSLTDVKVFAGMTPTLHVSVIGASPSFQWASNGVPIVGAVSSDYLVTGTQTTGTSTYSCTISNSYGTTTISPVSLTVLPDPSAPYPTTVLSEGPVAYFRLNEASGTTAYDYAGGNNASYTNALLAQPGYSTSTDPGETSVEFGDFPPDNDYAGNVPAYLNFGTNTGNAQFSVEAWVTQYIYVNGGDAIVALGYGGGGEQFVLDTGASGQGALRFFVRNAAGINYNANSTNILANDGLWHHVVGVCDEAAGHLYLYLDGNLVGSATIPAGSGLLASSVPLSIGARQSANNSPASYDFQFVGKVDDVAVYNKALTSAQVHSHYTASGIPPIITQIQPASQNADQGANATITVSANGTSPIGYQWYDNNNNLISGGTNATLSLSNLQPTQSGTYSVTVTDPYGAVSTNATVNVVVGPPQIVADVQPTSVACYAGISNTLSITVSGSRPFSYQWYLNGSAINGANNSSYTFAALPGTNAYYCHVSNSAGAVDSSVATVVGYPAPTVDPLRFSYKMKIQFTGYNHSGTLSDFPVLVRFGTNLAGFDYSQFASPAGGDLRFADASGSLLLPHEIDQWNDINGVSSVWVQVPKLSGTNDYIWAYWGNPSDTTPAASNTNGAVWLPASFQTLPPFDAVYHLKENGFPYADSAIQHPALSGAAPTLAYGMVGYGGAFASGSYLDCGTINLSNAFTLSAWVNVNPSANSIQTVWANSAGGFTTAGIRFYVNSYNTQNGALILEAANGSTGTQINTAAGAVSAGQWHLVTAAIDHDGGTAQLYVDGAVQASGTIRNDFPTNNDVELGRITDGAFAFNGGVDEARVRSGISSADWIWASWMTVASNSTFAAYSSVTNSSVKVSVQVTNNQIILAWPQGTLQSAPELTGPYSDIPTATSPYTNSITQSRQFYRIKVR